ncbi:hypothetical protein HY641_00340 [Candidatus Woesearchaeota archaeon]|nr:hypothetical protein [Candidatus Woesearchaeota archaeon]
MAYLHSIDHALAKKELFTNAFGRYLFSRIVWDLFSSHGIRTPINATT